MGEWSLELKGFIKDRIKIDPNGCWIWIGQKNTHGYGRVGRCKYFNGERSVHRLSYIAFNGQIPESMNVLHRCDVRLCCNPEHLFLGTLADNARDMVEKGRQFVLRGEANPTSKLTRQSVEQIRKNDGKLTVSDLARRFGVSRRAIKFVMEGATWA